MQVTLLILLANVDHTDRRGPLGKQIDLPSHVRKSTEAHWASGAKHWEVACAVTRACARMVNCWTSWVTEVSTCDAASTGPAGPTRSLGVLPDGACRAGGIQPYAGQPSSPRTSSC